MESFKIEKYEDFYNIIAPQSEEKYKEFNSKIVPGIGNCLGVRTPIMRKTAKSIAKENSPEEVFNILNDADLYEAKVIQGIMLEYIKGDSEKILEILDTYLKRVDNWALCDILTGNVRKHVKKSQKVFYEYAKGKIDSQNPWEVRFGLVMFLNHYNNTEYIDEIMELAKSVKWDHYYVNIGLAWLISYLFFTDKEKTVNLLSSGNLGKWVTNKSIQKIKESLKATKEDKELVDGYRI